MDNIVLPILGACVILLSSCNSLIYIDFDITKNDLELNGLSETTFEYVNSNDVLERAYQLATLEWTPIKDMPFRYDGIFAAGKTVKGVPYSSVKEINTYLFNDVSYHTFMTAVHNPNSVLYTENISEPPYHGVNCATYYGAVCSSSIMWAYGINIPYYANQIKDFSSMERIEPQQIDSLKICDIMWKSGHVQMIYNLEYDADTLYRVTTFETSGRSAHINSYSKERFRTMWNEGNYVGYRYKYMVYSDSPYNPRPLEDVTYNDDLCPSKGDKAIYRTEDEIVVNIFASNYDSIILEKDGVELEKDLVEGDSHVYTSLDPGIYSVSLCGDNVSSSSVSFEVADISVNYMLNADNTITVHFHSTATPEYLVLCTITGNSLYYPLSEQNKAQGSVTVPQMDISEYYCKVVFRGEYGSIINKPIRVL